MDPLDLHSLLCDTVERASVWSGASNSAQSLTVVSRMPLASEAPFSPGLQNRECDLSREDQVV